MASLIRVRVESTGWSGANGLNTFYFSSLTTPTPQAEATEAAARVRAFLAAIAGTGGIFGAGWSASLAPTVDVLNDQGGTLIGVLDAVDTTPVLGDPLLRVGPTNATALLRMGTAGIVDGRLVRGRANLGPVAEGLWLAGEIQTATRTGVEAAAETHLQTPISLAIEPVVWSRPKAGTPGRLGSQHPVLEYSVSPKAGTLRSRRD